MSVRETVAPELTRILPEPLRAALLPYAVARKMNVGCLAYDLLESCERFSFVNMVLDYSMTIPPVAWPQSDVVELAASGVAHISNNGATTVPPKIRAPVIAMAITLIALGLKPVETSEIERTLK